MSFLIASGHAIVYYLIIVIFLITLGSFHNFQAVENLTIPIIFSLLSLVELKPVYKHFFTKSESNKSNETITV